MYSYMSILDIISSLMDYKQIAEKVFLITDARKHMKDLGQTVPSGPAYIKHKIMGKEFDASKPEEYLKSFAIQKMG